MDNLLWNKILEFDLDSPFSEYGFSTRLADENYWTKNFTTKAILEYKKFMYLAGTSDFMVSPSEVIDTVWHQHLIYTQSYNDFCQLLGIFEALDRRAQQHGSGNNRPGPTPSAYFVDPHYHCLKL